MKKFKRMLAGLACVLAVCLCTPTAFAAKVIVYFDANGGICTSAAERTNADGQLTSLPTATMEGYTFDGWYTETVGGTKVTTSTVFTGDTTVYAHWTVKSTAASSSTSTSKPAQPEQTEQDDGMTLSILTVAGALLTTLAVAAFM